MLRNYGKAFLAASAAFLGFQNDSTIKLSQQAQHIVMDEMPHFAGAKAPARQVKQKSTSKLARLSASLGRGRKTRYPPTGGWTVAEGKRRARKRRNQQRHKAQVRRK